MPDPTNNIFGNQPPQPNGLLGLGGPNIGITGALNELTQDDQILAISRKLKSKSNELIFNIPTAKTPAARKKRALFIKILRDNDDRSRPGIQITTRTIAALKAAGFIKNPESYSTEYLLSNVLYKGLASLRSFVEVRIPERTTLPATAGMTGGRRTGGKICFLTLRLSVSFR